MIGVFVFEELIEVKVPGVQVLQQDNAQGLRIPQ